MEYFRTKNIKLHHYHHSLPFDFKVLGYGTSSRLSCVSWKTLLPILLIWLPSSKLNEESCLHPSNAKCSMERTLFGMTIFVSPLILKQANPIHYKHEFGSKTTSRNFPHSLNTLFSSSCTLLGIMTFSMLLPWNDFPSTT